MIQYYWLDELTNTIATSGRFDDGQYHLIPEPFIPVAIPLINKIKIQRFTAELNRLKVQKKVPKHLVKELERKIKELSCPT